MAYVQKTLLMAVGAGYRVDLGQDCGAVTVTCKADCYVKVVGGDTASPPTAPVATPAPAAGAVAEYIHLATSGDKQTVGADQDGRGFVPALQEQLRYVLVWAVAAGDLLIVGH